MTVNNEVHVAGT